METPRVVFVLFGAIMILFRGRYNVNMTMVVTVALLRNLHTYDVTVHCVMMAPRNGGLNQPWVPLRMGIRRFEVPHV